MLYFVASFFQSPVRRPRRLECLFHCTSLCSTDNSANLSCTGQCVGLDDSRVELRVVGQSPLPPQIPSCESVRIPWIYLRSASLTVNRISLTACFTGKVPVRYLGRETGLSWNRRQHVRPKRWQVSIKTECVTSQNTASILLRFNYSYPQSLWKDVILESFNQMLLFLLLLLVMTTTTMMMMMMIIIIITLKLTI